MNSLQEILQQAQRDLYCPTCGRNFSLNEIHIRGLFDHTVLLQTTCTNGHSPIIMVFVASYHRSNKTNIKPISSDDVLKTHEALKNFDGDFQSIWGKKKRKE